MPTVNDFANAVTDDSGGVVYLLHFSEPIGDLSNPRGRAQHYLGWTTNLAERLGAHETGNGSRLMEVISERGITWRLVRVWPGGRDLERKLKRQHNGPRLCPICRESRAKVEGPLRIVSRNDKVAKAGWLAEFRRLRLMMRLIVSGSKL